MKNITHLLNDLNGITPISANFWNDIQPLLVERQRKNGYLFLKPGHVAGKAWHLVSGFIVVMRTGHNGAENVARIYFPNDIVTDLRSFFEGFPIGFKHVGVGDITVLEIKKADLSKLEKYPETSKIIQHIAFIDSKVADENNQMLRLPEEERVKFFLENFPLAGLPAPLCASFLNLTLDLYLTLVETLLSSNQIIVKQSADTHLNNLEKSSNVAYKIINYLIANYTNPDIGDANEISAMFNMTSVTLNRMFIKNFGRTVPKFITKRRMEDAEEMLRSGSYNVGKVALAVGYKNIFHFSKAFKSYYGFPPKQGKQHKPQ
ncbi:helix-turn-helix domain-containing protein [Pedobacter gandavensis]|uniref:Helix-turn-helix domain-containing protein n=1 Tax=Pedobacter gandavensis TaxID=2679963 RepID=A0ABR6ET88_9SPHI|nr:helix-turn-helix domain-containing protein [Pedobacter gandavensis]MBB2148478.1 helix-turn-helix domain-containing protein [Pedobacter gandavensis]